MEKFVMEYSWIAMLVIMIVEFLIGKAKIKPNSTIDVVITVVKFLFGLDKKEEIKLKPMDPK